MTDKTEWIEEHPELIEADETPYPAVTHWEAIASVCAPVVAFLLLLPLFL